MAAFRFQLGLEDSMIVLSEYLTIVIMIIKIYYHDSNIWQILRWPESMLSKNQIRACKSSECLQHLR